MKLTPQHNLILNMLSDGAYHCPTVELFLKDDRKRISELNHGGYLILGDKTCDNPTHHHVSKVKLRKLVSEPTEIIRQVIPGFSPCCFSSYKFGTHDPQCPLKVKENVLF